MNQDVKDKVLSCVSAEGTHIRYIAEQTGMDIQIVASTLVLLELDDIVQQIPGKMYKRKNNGQTRTA